ncbi:hypothetical protein H4R24_001180 [Coemansia sp. RSA 988]|nr:hypothetical protein H4R24_001180 [Coemansia sp. RSA 988]
MNRKGQTATNLKTSSSKRPNLTYAQFAGNSNASDSDKTTNAPPSTTASQNQPAGFSVAAKQGRQRTPDNATSDAGNNGGPVVSGRGMRNGAGQRSHSRDTPVRLPSRNVVASSSETPAIQFGSLNQQTRSLSPPVVHRASGTGTTSGGVPATHGKSTTKLNFGTIVGGNSEDNSSRRPPNSSGSHDASARAGQHGRQQNHHQRQGSRSSGHGRQSQGYAPTRKDSSGSASYKHGAQKTAQKPHDAGNSGEAPPYPLAEGGYPGAPPANIPIPGGPAAHMPGGMSSQQPLPQQQQQQPHYAGSPYRGQHVRPPHNQSPGGQYKPQSGAHYPSHHMGTQPMSQPMGYPMPAPGQPMQPPIMTTQPNMQPMQGWMPAPPHQFYMPMGAPGYDQYYRPPQNAGGPPPHNIYGMPGYSMPNPTHANVPSQMGAGGIMPGAMGATQMPGMTASPVPGHQQSQPQPHHGLSASAQAFVPGARRPVRIVNPTTNEEVDVSQRTRSESATSSVPCNPASGTASPAPSSAFDSKRDTGTPADQPSSEESAKPKFKIPGSRALKIVNPNFVKTEAESPSEPAATKEAEPSAKQPMSEAADSTEAKETSDAGPQPMVVDQEKEKLSEPAPAAKALPNVEPSSQEKLADVESAAQPVDKVEEADVAQEAEPESKPSEPVVDALIDSLASTTIDDETKEESAVKPSLSANEAPTESLTETATADKEPEVEPIPTTKFVETTESVAKPAEPVSKPVEPVAEAAAEPTTKPADTITEKPAAAAEEQADKKSASEEGEIGELEEDLQPSLLGQNRSRQVTFSEPSSSSIQVLAPSEVTKLYSGDSNSPRIVDDILRYPRAFLERFSGLCKPPASFHFEITSTDDRWASERGSNMRRSASGSGRNRDSAASSGFGGMGNFRPSHTHTPLSSSEERFKQSTMDLKGRPEPGRGPMMGGRPPSGQFRGPGGGRESRGGRSGGRGRGRARGRGGPQQGGDRPGTSVELPVNFKPLEKSENRYIAKALRTGGDEAEDEMQEEVFDRRIRVLLNKITPDNFEEVSGDLLAWGEKSAKETDGRILRHLITLVFQKATDEPVWAKMYAQLCHKMICNTSTNVEDHSLRTKEGGYLSGGFLVRKYLLTKCQEDFEQGWKVEIPMDMESSEYYDAMKIKRRGLGLVKFIGELFLLDVLTLRIMHECVKRLLSNVDTPEEEETESLAKLLTTVGSKLDAPNAKSYMNAYFGRIQTMSTNKHLTSRIRFMLRDLIELRQGGWVTRVEEAGPKTIAEIHEDVERKKAADAAVRRPPSHMGRRADSHTGRGDSQGRRGQWSNVGGPSGSGRPEQNQRAGDLSGFGNLSRSKNTAPVGAGSPGNPFGAFASGSRGWRSTSSDGRKGRTDRTQTPTLSPGGRSPSHTSRNESSAATPEPVGTRNMFDALMNNEDEEAPRSEAAKASSKVVAAPSASATESRVMDSATIQRKVKGFINEYLELNSESEFIECFKELGEANFQGAVYEIVNNVMDRRPDKAEKIFRAVGALRTNDVIQEDTVVAALAEYSEQLEDMALDAPNAYKFFGMLMAAAHVSMVRIPEALGELATKLTSSRPPALQIIFAYLKQLVSIDGEDNTSAAIEEAKLDISRFFNKEHNSDADIKKALDFQDLGGLFPQYA